MARMAGIAFRHNAWFNLVLISPDTTEPLFCCSRAQVAGAAGVLVSAIKGQDVVQMRCQEEECRLPLRIFASMIPFDAALQLQVSFLPTRTGTKLELPKSGLIS